ncbi:MAG: exodeoxyribonuclease VII large subunit [Rhodospirillales bacterium RIFCSPLOWO2_12_FULL_58_28]|nr:MAG: exodeoxyribonuclease VII large subunit [Rhodospirillales bacterium RIFCSPLOWO2_02_FULL_58_16]OHC76756.1 MAG: exodeoxyribonuclease VII large subunit [Rhodospirillales bacterium RIFCSPLOWO2_12_FULL_58_28]
MATIENKSSGDTDHNLPVLSVCELSHALKHAVETSFSRVRVRGEISGFKRAASGHLYLRIKDEEAVLDAICWRGVAEKLGMDPQDGMEVTVTGRITTYAARSSYQIIIESMDLAGEGALLKLFEDRKKKLAAEGLFDAEHKKPIPFLPEVIGVVTSPTGAVIRDILHRLGERFERRVLIWPVLVQGKEAAAQIAAAVDGFNRLEPGGVAPRPDLLIVARGGGSLEDLWPFNEEVVVRAVFAGRIPLISAVGHETDVTLIDFVSDLRAPTPTAAAEMAVPVRLQLLAGVMDNGVRMVGAVTRLLEARRSRLEGLARGLPNLGRMADEAAQRLDDWTERLGNSLKIGVERRIALLRELAARVVDPRRAVAHAGSLLEGQARALDMAAKGLLRERSDRFARAAALLESCSHQRVLERGFALVYDGKGRHVGSAAGVNPGADISIRFHDGEREAIIGGRSKTSPKPKPVKKAAPDNGGQGTLL